MLRGIKRSMRQSPHVCLWGSFQISLIEVAGPTINTGCTITQAEVPSEWEGDNELRTKFLPSAFLTKRHNMVCRLMLLLLHFPIMMDCALKAWAKINPSFLQWLSLGICHSNQKSSTITVPADTPKCAYHPFVFAISSSNLGVTTCHGCWIISSEIQINRKNQESQSV